MCSHKDVTERRGDCFTYSAPCLCSHQFRLVQRETGLGQIDILTIVGIIFKEEVYKAESDISFGDSGSNFEAKSFSNICDFGQKLTKHFASMCWFFDYFKYWSKIHPSRGVDRSNESVSDAKNSCSTPAWSKNLSTYCPLSHLMPRSFPWARNPITLVNSRKGRG